MSGMDIQQNQTVFCNVWKVCSRFVLAGETGGFSGGFDNKEDLSNEKLKKLIWVGALDQLTHADDSLINFTDWADRIKKDYEQCLANQLMEVNT